MWLSSTTIVAMAVQELFPQKPYILFGHSMGSLVARCYTKKYDSHLDKLILCGFNFTINGYLNLFSLLQESYSKKNWLLSKPDLPILFVAGALDPVIGGERGWQESLDFMGQMGYTQIHAQLYQGLRHEILNEENRSLIFSDLLKWMMD